MAASAGNARAQGAGIGSVTATGKWTQPGVPHKGWTCVDIEDLGSPAHVCEMCEVQDVRYVHIMEHANYAGPLRVGCICAGHMEENLVGARLREDAFKASRSRRDRWLSRSWRTSRAGNQYLNTDGFNVVVYPVSAGFGARIEHRETGWGRTSKRHYATEEHAKLAAFDAMIVAKARGARRIARTDEIRRRLVAPTKGA
jgi:hypothetical protein